MGIGCVKIKLITKQTLVFGVKENQNMSKAIELLEDLLFEKSTKMSGDLSGLKKEFKILKAMIRAM